MTGVRYERRIIISRKNDLESLERLEKSIAEIAEDTGLKTNLICNIVSHLVMDNIINLKRGKYFLNLKEKEKWLPLINNKILIQQEIKELFISLINSHFELSEKKQYGLKVKKIWLNSMDEKILEAHFNNLNEFIENMEKYPARRKVEKLKEKRVIFWGQSFYGDLAEESLKAS